MAEDLNKQQSPAQEALAKYVESLYKSLSRTRYAEEREWASAGYFDQLKQWLDEDPQTGALRPISKKKDKKWPMPVTNLFSKVISLTANALGADVPRMRATSDNYDNRNRRAAEAAENAIDAANRESGMEVLNPILAKRTVLWGLGAAYDTIAFDRSTVEVPEIASPAAAPAASDAAVAPDNQGGNEVPAGGGPEGGEVAAGAEAEEPAISGIATVPTARLKTRLLTPFETYLPRDCEDANTAPFHLLVFRDPVGDCKEMYPDYVKEFEGGDKDDNNIAFYYLNTLRSLAYMGQSNNEQDQPKCTLKHLWTDWNALPKDVQDAIQKEWNQPSEVYEEQGFTKLQAAIEYGLFCVVYKGCVVQWSENPWDGDKATTFFPFQKDCVSVYPKGQSVELIPLTKKLNRVDSLIEREAMSTGTTKVLWPTTQTTQPPTGDPVELLQWDPIGEGKVRPEVIPGAMNSKLMAYRQTIVEDIKELGMTNQFAEGQMPGSGTPYRLAAFMSAKAEESRQTMRFLWEQAHELRARKLVKMARKVWTEPRKIQTAGYNNRFGATELEAADLEGGYELNVVQDSSKPKTMTEKLQVLQMAQEGGYVNPQDPGTRDYVLSTLGLNDIDPTDHLQYEKAERDLEKLKNGQQPMESPFEKWDIPLRVIATYTLTEEFEGLTPAIRNGILMWAQYLSEKLQVAQGAPLGAPPQPGPLPLPAGPSHPQGRGPAPAGVGGQSPSHIMGQVPGAQISTPQVEAASIREAANVVPNSPSPTA